MEVALKVGQTSGVAVDLGVIYPTIISDISENVFACASMRRVGVTFDQRRSPSEAGRTRLGHDSVRETRQMRDSKRKGRFDEHRLRDQPVAGGIARSRRVD